MSRFNNFTHRFQPYRNVYKFKAFLEQSYEYLVKTNFPINRNFIQSKTLTTPKMSVDRTKQ